MAVQIPQLQPEPLPPDAAPPPLVPELVDQPYAQENLRTLTPQDWRLMLSPNAPDIASMSLRREPTLGELADQQAQREEEQFGRQVDTVPPAPPPEPTLGELVAQQQLPLPLTGLKLPFTYGDVGEALSKAYRYAPGQADLYHAQEAQNPLEGIQNLVKNVGATISGTEGNPLPDNPLYALPGLSPLSSAIPTVTTRALPAAVKLGLGMLGQDVLEAARPLGQAASEAGMAVGRAERALEPAAQEVQLARRIEKPPPEPTGFPTITGEPPIERGLAASLRGAPTTPPELVDVLEKLPETYGPKPDTIRRGEADLLVQGEFEYVLKKLMGSTTPQDEVTMTAGLQMIPELYKQGRGEEGADLARQLSAMWTQAGRVVQAAHDLKSVTPDGVLYYTHRILEDGIAEHGLSAIRKRLAQSAEQLITEGAWVVQGKVINAERQALAALRPVVSKNKLILPQQLAESFVERAQALQALPEGPQQWRATRSLLTDIHNLVPPTRWEQALSILNLRRAFIAAFDDSFMLRQGIFQVSRPEWRDAFKASLQALKSEDAVMAVEDRLLFGPLSGVRKLAGVEFIDRNGPLAQQEETFMTNLAGKLPGFTQSERAYITAGNKLRADVWDNTVRGWLPPAMQDKTFTTLEEVAQASGHDIGDFQKLGKWLNVTTGRGDITWLKTNATALNVLFFAPRLFVSRFQVPYYALKYGVTTPALRGEVARDLASFIGFNAGLLLLLEKSGVATVETDPRSSDFGQVRMGPVRFNFWAGYQPLAHIAAELLSGQLKTTSGTGRMLPVDKSQILFNYLMGKLNPGVETGVEQVMGQAPYEGPLDTPQKRLARLATQMVPFLGSDMKQAWDEAGIGGALGVAPLSFFGGQVGARSGIRDIQNKEAQAAYKKDYLDLAKSQREAINEQPSVQQELQQLEQRQTGRKPAYQEALIRYQEVTTSLEKDLRQFIDAGATGKVLRGAIQDFKTARFHAGTTLFPDSIVAEMQGGLEKPLKDVLRDRYWSVEAAEDPVTGRVDFKGQQQRRSAVLDEAAQAGIDKAYILDRGQRFEDPLVKKTIEGYEQDQEMLKPYWELEDGLLGRMPALQQLRARADTARQQGNSALAHALEERLSQAVAPFRQQYVVQHPELAKILLRWGYNESKVTQALAAR